MQSKTAKMAIGDKYWDAAASLLSLFSCLSGTKQDQKIPSYDRFIVCKHVSAYCFFVFPSPFLITPGKQSYTFTSPVSLSNNILQSKRGDRWWRGFILRVWTREFPADEAIPSIIYLFSQQRCTHRNTRWESRLTAAPHFISKLCEPPFKPRGVAAVCFRYALFQALGAPPHSMSSVARASATASPTMQKNDINNFYLFKMGALFCCIESWTK